MANISRGSNLSNANSKKPSRYHARSAAALVIKKMLVDGQSLNHNLAFYSENLAQEEQGLCKAICFGVCRYYRSLSTDIDSLLDSPLRKKDYDIYALLLIGAYQLDKMRTPSYAAIDSCVNASKELKKTWAKGLINAVLRKYQTLSIKPSAGNEKVMTEHPDWLIGKIKKMWPESSSLIFQQNNQEPPLCLRINEKQISRQAYVEILEEEGISFTLGTIAASAVYLPDKGINITDLPFFQEGYFSVQDEAPQLAAFLLDAQDEDKLLDACAAPGGKTCHLLEHNPNTASVTAIDMDEKRLERVKENLLRLQLNATCIASDILDIDNWYDGQAFDRILADVPCSATGVIRRHPDIKWLRQADDIKALALLQQDILKTLWKTLKPGGVLLYATCSVLKQENVQVIKAFLESEKTASHVTINRDLGKAALQCDFGVQFLPQADGHDGFYYALLQKECS